MKGSKIQLEKMRWVIFWVFTALFVILSSVTLLATFFEVGSISQNNKDLLINGVLVEIAAAMFALFYALFGIQRTQKKTEAIRVRLVPPGADNPAMLFGLSANCTLVGEGVNASRKEIPTQIINDGGPMLRIPPAKSAAYVLISVTTPNKELSGSFSMDSRVVELQEA